MQVNVEYDGFPEADRKILRVVALLSDLRPFWPIVANLWIGWMGRHFDTEGAFGRGSRWQPLSQDYARWKQRVYPGKRILQADGDLRRAATTPKRLVTPMSLTLTIDPFMHGPGRTGHQSGEISPVWFEVGTARMPARPLLFDLNEQMRREVEMAAERYVDSVMRSV